MKESRRQKAEREFAVLREPETLDDLVMFIADRGTLSEWCKVKNLRYTPVYEWLHDIDFPVRLERYTKAMEARQDALKDVVISGLRDIAQADVRKAFDEKGGLLDPHRLPDELARVVAEISEDEDERGKVKRKVKLESRKGGHELLGRALGLYKDRIEHEGKVTLEELVAGGGGEGHGSHKAPTGMPPRAASEPPPPSGPRSASKT